MNKFVKLVGIVGILGGIGAAGYGPAKEYLRKRSLVTWETVPVAKGDIVRYVNSTGEVKPVLSVAIGSFVSGPIVELNVDFNDEVRAGEVLAKVDPQLFLLSLARDQASLETRDAELERVEAQLQQALNNYQRGKNLREKNVEYLSDREMDALVFDVKSLQAQRKLAAASILQAKALLETSQANLVYCDITSPVDGIVIDRKIDPGQTLAAQFQAPELFIIAPDLRKQVHIFASVDEADIGLIQKAKAEKRPVTFNVDAHPDEVFIGHIEQIRVNSVSNQNVVTYPVVISAANPDLKLLPGMTASISFEVDSCRDVEKIPRAAIRFFPDDVNRVREADKKLIDGSTWKSGNQGDDDEPEELNATEKAEAKKAKNKSYVWAVEGEKLKAIEVFTGISDFKFTQIVSGELKAGDLLVTGQKVK